MSSTMLVDGHNILMRSIHASHGRGMLSESGVDTGALTVFIGMLSGYVRDWGPSSVVVCWDHGPCQRRREIYPAYKAARREAPEQDDRETHFGLAKKFLSLAGIQQVAVPGYEADDLIAAYCHKTGDNRIIVSGDKDLLQLLRPGIIQLRPISGGGYDLWTPEKVVQEYGCDPFQLPLLMALAGDPTDGVPGVAGMGPKRSLSALQKADWELDMVPALQDEHKRVAALTSLALVDLTNPEYHPPVPPGRPFDPRRVGEPGGGYLMTFVASLTMIGVGNRLIHDTLWTGEPRPA
jgi:5'-3' exonuclease